MIIFSLFDRIILSDKRQNGEGCDNMDLSIKEMRQLYEGMTQKDPSFREAIGQLSDPPQDTDIFSDLDRTKNRLNYAMLGVHPIYQREVELSGMIDHKEGKMYLYGGDNDIEFDFEDLDPAYVAFIENQKRIHNSDSDTTPLSSVALEASNALNKDKMEVPDISGVQTNLPEDVGQSPRELLEKAFVNSMVMMTNLKHEIDSRGLSDTYGTNKDHLLQHVASDSFNNSFERSVDELSDLAKGAVNDYGL